MSTTWRAIPYTGVQVVVVLLSFLLLLTRHSLRNVKPTTMRLSVLLFGGSSNCQPAWLYCVFCSSQRTSPAVSLVYRARFIRRKKRVSYASVIVVCWIVAITKAPGKAQVCCDDLVCALASCSASDSTQYRAVLCFFGGRKREAVLQYTKYISLSLEATRPTALFY